MPQYQVQPVDRSEWLTLAAQFHDHSYRQTWEYGRLLADKRRATSSHIKIMQGNDLLGLADVRIKRAPFLGGVAYISGGPLTRRSPSGDPDRLAACLDALRQEFVDAQGLILRIHGTLGDPAWLEHSAAVFAAQGFTPAAHGTTYRTLVVDLQPSLADIRSALAQKWRNCLNKAQRTNPAPAITTRIEDFDRFATLFAPFVDRKGFSVDLGAEFYRAVQSHSDTAESLTLTILESEGKLLAGHLSSMLGDTCVYLLGATSDEALKTNAAYLLQWHVIEAARQRGLRWYDLGGIDPEANPGVFHFKSGLSGREMRAPGPFELAPRALRTRFILAAESAYRRFRRRDQKPQLAAAAPAAP